MSPCRSHLHGHMHLAAVVVAKKSVWLIRVTLYGSDVKVMGYQMSSSRSVTFGQNSEHGKNAAVSCISPVVVAFSCLSGVSWQGGSTGDDRAATLLHGSEQRPCLLLHDGIVQLQKYIMAA